MPVEFGWKTKKCHLPKGQMTLCYEILCSASAKLRNYGFIIAEKSSMVKELPCIYSAKTLLNSTKQPSREIIESAINGSLSSCPAENSTIYRWSRELKSRHK